MSCTGRFFVDRFTVTGAPPAASHIRILLMNQYAGWLITFGMKEVINFVNSLTVL
jgi:hypothetical protein